MARKTKSSGVTPAFHRLLVLAVAMIAVHSPHVVVARVSEPTVATKLELFQPIERLLQQTTEAPTVSGRPSSMPSTQPSSMPSLSDRPSSMPSTQPSSTPSLSSRPSTSVSSPPSRQQSSSPSSQPSMKPSLSGISSAQPSVNPSISESLSGVPSLSPSLEPSMNPSILLDTIQNNRGTDGYGLCQGDCDRDTDCIGDLLCFQRTALEPVPGCSGSGAARRDYCFVRPPNSLFDVGNNLGTNAYGLCDGDCDQDTDCIGALRCFRRGRGSLDPVLGCDGIGTRGTDYCFDRPPNFLFDVGNNLGNNMYGLCEGDCDEDADCIGDLLCEKRNDLSMIPGCVGEGRRGFDYCRPLVLPTQNPTAPLTAEVPSSSPIPSNTPTTSPTQNPTSPPTSASPTSSQSPTFPTLPLTRVGNNGRPESVFPLGQCEGDCDDDSDCEASFKCFQRNGREEIPGCEGLGQRGTDYCFFRPPNFLFDIGNNLIDDSYDLCEGDCDEDADCMNDLRCFRRRGFETVPGCEGLGRRGADYCFRRPPNSLFDIDNNLGANAYGLCDGDCDADADCKGDLRCFRRSAFETVPGCSEIGRRGSDYCFDRPPNSLFDVGNNLGTGSYGLCEGDCDEDTDCTDGLRCFLRPALETIPGCTGTGTRNFDYCIPVDTIPSVSGFPSSMPSSQPSSSLSENPSISGQLSPMLSQPPSISVGVSSQPSVNPSISDTPTLGQSSGPSTQPSMHPSLFPTLQSSTQPSETPPVLVAGLVLSPNCIDSFICLQNPEFGVQDNTRYNIDLSLQIANVESASAYVSARDRWMEIITGDLPGFNVPDTDECINDLPAIIDDLFICGRDQAIDGPNGILGSAGPNFIRTDPVTGRVTSIAGNMMFDSADVLPLIESGGWESVILHEMGHIIGVGTLWDLNDLVNAPLDYLGDNAIAVWTNDWSCDSTPPVERNFGPGTRGGHWDEECLQNELMTGFLAGTSNPISRLTIASLQDIGYDVNMNAADAYDGSDTTCCNPTDPIVTPDILFSSATSLSESKPHLSDAGRDAAVAHGKQMLQMKQRPENLLVEGDDNGLDNGLIYVGDQQIVVLYAEDGQIYDVHVTNES